MSLPFKFSSSDRAMRHGISHSTKAGMIKDSTKNLIRVLKKIKLARPLVNTLPNSPYFDWEASVRRTVNAVATSHKNMRNALGNKAYRNFLLKKS